jgi:serine protease Do
MTTCRAFHRLQALFFLPLTLWALLTPDLCVAADVTTAIKEVAKRNIPAVAHIEVTERVETPTPFLPFEKDPLLRRFFGGPKAQKKHKGEEVTGLGSGMVMDGAGHILTAYHVAGGATKIEVLLSDGSRYTAKLVGGDPKTDIAVIRIEAKGKLPAVTFGDSDKIEVGDWVVAIGHPRGLDQTVTQGIISAKHRGGILDPTSYQDFLQTDASINPGNSGGPLLNLQGEVIGVNTAIASASGGSEGIGFAVPSNIAVHIGKTLIAYGKVERGWLGISVGNLTPEKAKEAGVQPAKGALVADVVKGSPAEKAGIRKGDVIVAYNGKPVPDAASLQNEVTVTPIGRDVKITFQREAKRQEVTMKLASLKEATKSFEASAQQRLGASFGAIPGGEAQKLGLEPNQGVAITRVEPKGPLARAGFEVGDLIIQISGQTIGGTDSFAELVATIPPSQKVSLLAVDPKKQTAGTIQVTLR